MQRRVLAIASGGGHFVQLMRLSPAWAGHAVSIATVDAGTRLLAGDAPFFTFRDVSRADWWRIPLATLDIARILIAVRPQVIITTDALPRVPTTPTGSLGTVEGVTAAEAVESSELPFPLVAKTLNV